MLLSLKSGMVLTVFNNFHQQISVFDQNPHAGDFIVSIFSPRVQSVANSLFGVLSEFLKAKCLMNCEVSLILEHKYEQLQQMSEDPMNQMSQ